MGREFAKATQCIAKSFDDLAQCWTGHSHVFANTALLLKYIYGNQQNKANENDADAIRAWPKTVLNTGCILSEMHSDVKTRCLQKTKKAAAWCILFWASVAVHCTLACRSAVWENDAMAFNAMWHQTNCDCWATLFCYDKCFFRWATLPTVMTFSLRDQTRTS